MSEVVELHSWSFPFFMHMHTHAYSYTVLQIHFIPTADAKNPVSHKCCLISPKPDSSVFSFLKVKQDFVS